MLDALGALDALNALDALGVLDALDALGALVHTASSLSLSPLPKNRQYTTFFAYI